MRDHETTLPPRMSDGDALATISRSTVAMVLTNPRIDDNPIVYVNDAFERMTGFSRDMSIGRNCRFLQCDETDPADVGALRRAIHRGEELGVDLTNRRADGSTFTNRLLVSPIRDEDGEIIYFLGVQKLLTEEEAVHERKSGDRAMQEIQHRVKNHLAMIVGLIRVQARDSDVRSEYQTLSRRVESLQLLYEELTRRGPGRQDSVDMGAYLSRIGHAIAHLDGRAGIRVDIDSTDLQLPVDAATRFGLILSEVLTNALQHAFDGRETGVVRVRIRRGEDGEVTARISDDGIGIPEATVWPDDSSLGGRIVLGLLDGLRGTLDVAAGAEGGTVVTIRIRADAARID